MTIYRGTGTTSNGTPIEDYLASKVERSGDTMTGPLNVPAGASGTQVPQKGEVDTALALKANIASKDATGGYAGLTLFKINFKNVANTFISFFTNSNTAARTYTFQDRDGTIADISDITTVYGRRNLVINGAFDIAQRNTTQALTTSFAYGCVDRWGFLQATTAACTASQVAIATSGIPFRYGLKLQRTAAATTTGVITSATAFETIDSVKFAGKQVTLSFYAKAGANYSASGSILNFRVYTGTGTDQAANNVGGWTGSTVPFSVAQVITTTLTRYTVTGTIAAGATQIAILADWTPVGTAGADDSVTITGVQLEVGATATDFEFRSVQDIYGNCRRYWRPFGNSFSGGTEGTDHVQITEAFNPPMRVAPTSSLISGRVCYFRYSGTDATISSPSIVAMGISVDGCWALIGGGSGYTGNIPVTARQGASTLFIALDAEL